MSIPVSATASGALIGTFVFPGIGTAVGAGIGAVVDIARIGLGAKDKIRRAKRAFAAQLLARYNNTVFISALERMAGAMQYLVELGVKPGTAAFDKLMAERLSAEIGYKGNCEIDLYGPAVNNQPRPLLAQINSKGEINIASPSFTTAHGQQWAEACKEIHKEALIAWTQDRADEIEHNKELEETEAQFQRDVVTRVAVNGSIILLTIGLLLRKRDQLGMRK